MVDLRETESLARIHKHLAVQPEGLESDLAELVAFLVASEKDTLALITYLRDPPIVPVSPPGGDIEGGFVIYWLHNLRKLPWEIQLIIDTNPLLLLAFEELRKRVPPSQITTPDYEWLEQKYKDYGAPGPDGTMYGHKKYQQLDTGWMISALNYVANVLDHDLIHAMPANGPAVPIVLSRKDGDSSKDPVLGIVGDWGTGYYTDEGGAKCPAQRVMEQITNPAKSPPIDYLIHLGDVYYAGTDWRPLPFEERDNFYNLWPDQKNGRNFTLNSNHEMYGGATGYFDVALQAGGKFAAQAGKSYYALKYGPWLVLCLDSAYYSDAENGRKMYMAGAIGTCALDRQIQWVEKFSSHKGPIMVMTHHSGGGTLNGQVTKLYKQVLAALKRPPTVWYWGHVHNGIVYDKLRDFNSKPVITYPTKGRCCGHGAIPFGKAWGLEDKHGKQLSNILYYAHTPDPELPDTSGTKPLNPRVRNGYALVTLHSDGGFTEAFYETGASQPLFKRRWAAAELEDCG